MAGKGTGACHNALNTRSARCWECYGSHDCPKLDPWLVPLSRALVAKIEGESPTKEIRHARQALRVMFGLVGGRKSGENAFFDGFTAMEYQERG
ncbi:hypothetical protein NQ176_g10493 [Zarea fungicola]|uniref:Uncharacterized protein n=1 Tax=Zarea fungicola TaxID=93591 RepID=A0ACC1MFE5_9HYPO|nr:hypothetical protein NQ176_g10493 [Lecanicillium fungicola]